MPEDARRAALDRLVVNAHAVGADAAMLVRFDLSEVGQSLPEIVAYGKACVLREA